MSAATFMSMSKGFSASAKCARTAARRQAAFRTLQAECASLHWLASWPLDWAWQLGPTGRSTGLIWLTSLLRGLAG
eukprot:11766257-Alexandrium_andersonii.AAC.1